MNLSFLHALGMNYDLYEFRLNMCTNHKIEIKFELFARYLNEIMNSCHKGSHLVRRSDYHFF